jgi:regulatory protein
MLIRELQYRQRRSGAEVTMHGDDESVTALDAEVAVRFQLQKGMQISPALLSEIVHENECLCARRKLIRYLALRKKSTSDAQRYLQRAGFSTQAIEVAIESARNLQYLDDSDYADAFVRTRAKSGTKGPRVVSKELQAKGIPSDEVKRAIAPISDPESQLESARRVAAKKYPTLKDETDLVKSARRMSQHLARRGFDPEICDRVTREFFGDPTQF